MTEEPLADIRKRRRTAIREILTRCLIMAVAVYVVFGAMLYIFQRDFMYAGKRLAAVGTPEQHGIKGISDVKFMTPDGLSLHGWFAPARDAGKPTILFFHGNGSNIKGFYPKARIYMEKGFGVFLCEYRGYGGNPGETTEEGLYNDAEGCLFALKNKGYGPWNLVYYGESLGSGVAVNLAVRHPPKALVLESPYTSTVAVAKRSYGWYPVSWLMKDQFDSIGKIGKVKSRVFIVHGEADGLIPFTEGSRLYDAANQPKEFYAVAGGGHSDLYAHGAGEVIPGWLESRKVGMYVPKKSYPGRPSEYGLSGMEEIAVTTEDELRLNAWFAPPRAKSGRIVVYFPGNMGDRSGAQRFAKMWMDKGYGVYLLDYRGFGGNPGNPSEEGIYRDARAGLSWLREKGYAAKQFIYYGYSLGASVAIQAATEVEPGLLVLQSSGSNALDVLNWQRPAVPRDVVADFINERFENLGKMPKIHAPVLFLHGEKDDVVPLHLARKLFDSANEPKTFKTFPAAGHADLGEHGARELAAEWISKNTESIVHASNE